MKCLNAKSVFLFQIKVLTIIVLSMLIVSAESTTFSDVAADDWFYRDVAYVAEHGLMNGTGEATFSPSLSSTRAMIVTILWRLEGEPPAGYAVPFEDVHREAYYAEAVSWAYENELINGYSDTVFAPNDPVTREQIAAMFYRFAQYKEYDVSQTALLDCYSDKDEIGSYAVKALQWANATGLITGMSSDVLAPKENTLRCQTAAILKRFHSMFLVDEYDSDESENNTDIGFAVNSESAQNKSQNDYLTNANKNQTSDNNHETHTASNKDKTENEKADIENCENGDEIPQTPEQEATSKPSEPITDVSKPTIYLDRVGGKVGDVVEVHICIRNNPGILGMRLAVDFDDTVFKLESVKNGAAVADVLDFTPSNILESGSGFVWDGLEISSEQIRDGVLLLLRFRILPEAKGKEYPIQVTYESGDIVNNALESLEIQIENGAISVE